MQPGYFILFYFYFIYTWIPCISLFWFSSFLNLCINPTCLRIYFLNYLIFPVIYFFDLCSLIYRLIPRAASPPVTLHVTSRHVSLRITNRIIYCNRLITKLLYIAWVIVIRVELCFQVEIYNGIVRITLMNPSGMISSIGDGRTANVLEYRNKEARRGSRET